MGNATVSAFPHVLIVGGGTAFLQQNIWGTAFPSTIPLIARFPCDNTAFLFFLGHGQPAVRLPVSTDCVGDVATARLSCSFSVTASLLYVCPCLLVVLVMLRLSLVLLCLART